MTAAQLYATVTFLGGIILLLGWLYLTAANSRSTRMLLKSVLLFVLLGAVVTVLSLPIDQLPLALWAFAFIEESLKATAASTEKEPMDRFLLVALFGIWELMLAKPLWGLSHAALLQNWTNLQLVGLTGAGIVAVLMHLVTAEIYAFHFKGRLLLALLASWVLHAVYNESVDMLGVSRPTTLLLFLPLLLLFLALWPKVSPQTQSAPSS